MEWPIPILGSFVSHFIRPSDWAKATSRESAAFDIAQKRRIVSPKRTGLVPIAQSKERGLISCLHASVPSNPRDAMTDDPKTMKTCFPSVAGVDAA